MAETVAPANIEARIQGEVSGQLIVGNHNVQVLAEHGALVNVIASEQVPVPRPRATPVLTLRPRRFQGLLDRQKEIESVISGLDEGPVEIYGEPGIGKTSILRYLAYHPEVERFQAGAVYRSARREPPADLLQFLFEAFYESDVPFKPTETQVRHFLREKHALVLLDDIELGREDIEELTNAVPACVFVIVSAQRRLWGEAPSIAVKGLPAEEATALVSREMGRPLTPEETEAARALCAALEGNPLRILQEVAAAREERRSLRTLPQMAEAARRPWERIEQSLDSLSESERAVLATLAAFGGASVHSEHLAALCALPDAADVLLRLLQRKLIQVHDFRYRLTGSLPGVLERAWDLTSERERALAYFAAWAERHKQSPDDLLKENDCIRELLGWADLTGRWIEVQRLGRAIDGALTLSGRWESWKSVVQGVLRASRALGDKAGEAWALHQLGTRALCLSDPTTARSELSQALRIRESLRDEVGAAVSRHNLDLLPIVPQTQQREPDSSPPVGGTSTGIPLLLKIGGSALLLGLAGLGLRQILINNTIARPSALTARAAPSQVNLTWVDNSDNESGFRIERRTGGGIFSEIARVDADSTTFTDTNFDANTTYTYRVRAASADGESEYSNEPTILTIPAAPSDLSVAAPAPNALELRWIDKSPDSSGFKIERSADGGVNYIDVATVAIGTISYLDSGITAEATYYYRVRATNASGDSGYSNTAIWSASPEPPVTPRIIEAAPVSSRRTMLRWVDTSRNETGFKIERKIGSGAYSQIALVEANKSVYEDSGVNADASYTYRIRATNPFGDSSYSNEVRVSTPAELPAAPTALAGVLEQGKSANLSWSDNSDNEAGFRIERRSSRDPRPRMKTIPAGAVRFTDPDLLPDTRYTYRVQAFNRAGSSAFSNEVTIPTAPAPGTISVSTRRLSFGVVSVGSTAIQEVTISNVGPGLLIGGVASPGPPFRVASGQQNFTLSRGQISVVKIEFEPSAAGRFMDKLVINANDLQQHEVQVTLMGVGRPQRAVRLLSIDLSTSWVVGGEEVGGRVTLSAAASEGGARITISTDSRAVRTPATLLINAGESSARFVIKTIQVRSGTQAAVSASFNGDTRTATLTLEPPKPPQPDVRLASLDLSRSRVKGGESLAGRVTLSGRAPTGGVVVTLSSSPVVGVPASVTVNAGNNSVPFRIKTNRVRTRTVAEILASLGGDRRTASLELEPEEREPQPQVGLVSLDLSRNRVKGGESLEGRVTLGARAPSGGVVVALSSSPVVGLPASVTVSVGNSSAAFRVKTYRVRTRMVAEIVALLGGEKRIATLEVEPEGRQPQPEVGLASLVLSRNRVKGGESLEGRVTLSDRAPAGGVTVALSSSRVVGLPATVTVNAGNDSVSFRIKTNRIRTRMVAEIVATLGRERRIAALEVEPEEREPQPQVGLASLGLSRKRVKGGEPLEGKIMLTRAAPQVLEVNLSSSNPAIASVPPIVRVNAGSSVATFTIKTSTKRGPRVSLFAAAQIRGRPQRPMQQVEITARLFGTSRTAELEVW